MSLAERLNSASKTYTELWLKMEHIAEPSIEAMKEIIAASDELEAAMNAYNEAR